jgi:hypothetical protein
MSNNAKKKPRVPAYEPTGSIQYPDKSSVKIKNSKYNPQISELYFDNVLDDNVFENNYIPDKRLKPLKKYYRPHFSPKFNSWIMDLVYCKQTENQFIFLF